MGSRLLVAVALALLAVPAAAYAIPVQSTPATAIGLGFGPLSIQPVGSGGTVPLYAPGDQLWVQSYETASGLYLTLTFPSNGSGPVTLPTVLLEAGGLVNVHTFAPNDPLGNYTLSATDQTTGATAELSVPLVNASSRLAPKFTGASLSLNSLRLGYTLPPTSAYDIQACTMGSTVGPDATVQLSGGTGTLRIRPDGGAVYVSRPTGATPVTAWFQLNTQRAYRTGDSVASEQTLAAQSGSSFTVTPGPGSIAVPLNQFLNLRPGRYDFTIFVNGASGTVSYDAPYLKTNSTAWVSLGWCSQTTAVTTGSFMMTTNLDNANSTWPRLLYTMYSEQGVDSFTVSRVPAAEGRVDVRNSARPAGLTGVTFKATAAGLQASDGFDSSLFVIADTFPLKISLSITFGGVTTQTYHVTLESPFATVPIAVDAGTLTVHTASGGSPLSNATIYISAGGTPGKFSSDPNGNVTVTLPPGSYNVTAAYGGKSVSTTATVQAGASSYASLQVAVQGVPMLFYSLVAALAVGVVLNAFVWRAYLARRSL